MANATLQINDSNDLYLPDGENLMVLTGLPAITQDVLTATLMRLGEDIYNINTGVDYFGTIFTSAPDQDAAQQSLSDNILAVSDDITDIEELNVAIGGGVFSFAAFVNTIYGPTTVASSQ